MGAKKNFVIDTNVILHDYNCLKNFQENDIYLPIVVLEELDKFKKGNEQINFNAREFLRELDLVTDDNLFNKGASLGEGLGSLFVIAGSVDAPDVFDSFPERIPDHKILAVVDWLTRQKKDMKTILVTKDVNLRMKARSIGLLCEDYINDKVINVDIFEKSNEVFEGIDPRNAEQSFAFEVLTDPNIKLVALTGKAGTGKTLLALAAALSQMNDYKQILLARPIVALSNKDIGFLPGDAKEKVAPYMQPLFDNLNVIKRQFASNSTEVKRLEDMQKSEQLVIEALAFIRGRSLSETYCIIDEAQNLTPHEIKTIITRAGEGTKMVFTGDIQQIDQPYLDSQSNGLVYMIDRMKDQNLFAHVNLLKGERSQLSELASNLM